MATLDELQQQLAALSARVDALTTPPDDYYTSKYSGEEIDAGIEKTGSLPESWPLPIASGGTGADTAQLALANLGGRPNRNIARNPDFKINQRNFSSDNWTSGYGPDGWISTGAGSLEYSGGPVKTNNQYLHQYYEPGEIDAGIYTFSAFCTDNVFIELGYWGGSKVSATSTNFDNGFASITVEITEGMVDAVKKGYLYVLCKNNGTISRIKLEKSPFQTLAYKDSSGNWHSLDAIDYGEELLRCFRYYYDSGSRTTGANGSIKTPVWDTAATTSSSHFSDGVRFPVPMRTAPAISFYSGGSRTPNKVAYGSTGADALATPQAANVGPDGFSQVNLVGEDPTLSGTSINYFYIANAEL